ncbi:hypothetical protein M0805_003713 [Coniferiporia weirii]|nr:hypothetical protein M0805_003713 [Coniferiporia weirii]
MSEALKGGFASFANASKPAGATNTTPSTNLFGNATPATNPGAAGVPGTGTPSAFGGGGGLFGGFGAKPATTGSLFGGGTSGATAPATGTSLFGGFGNNAATSSTPTIGTPAAQSSTPAPSPFGIKPTEQATNVNAPGMSSSPKPAGGLFSGFGGSTTPASTASPAAPSFFAAPQKPAEPNTTAASASVPTPAPTGGSLFGNNLFGKKPDATAMSTAPPASAVPAVPAIPTAPSLFGNFGAKKDDDTAKDKAPTPTAPTGGLFGQPAANKDAPASTPGSSFGLFGQKPAENKDASQAPVKEGEKKDAAPTLSAFGSNTAGKTTTTATSGMSAPSGAAGISVPPPSMLRGKTIEEIVNKWSSDLESHVREFNRLAGEVAVWDRALIDNGNTIAALFQHVLVAEREQSDIEQSLKHVEDQQKELAATLEVFEKATGEIFDGQGGGLRALDVGPADAERDKHYTLAADLNANLDDLSRSLMQMIDSVNALSTSPEDVLTHEGDSGKAKGDAPLEQIAQILSSHLESLQWIDGAVREVDSKVTDVEQRVREASSGSRSGGRSRGFGLR